MAELGACVVGVCTTPLRQRGRGLMSRTLRRVSRRAFAVAWYWVWQPWCALVVSQGAFSFWHIRHVYGFVWLAFVLDDHLFGDDDLRRRRWEAVRNKIRWLMELPKPSEPTTA